MSEANKIKSLKTRLRAVMEDTSSFKNNQAASQGNYKQRNEGLRVANEYLSSIIQKYPDPGYNFIRSNGLVIGMMVRTQKIILKASQDQSERFKKISEELRLLSENPTPIIKKNTESNFINGVKEFCKARSRYYASVSKAHLKDNELIDLVKYFGEVDEWNAGSRHVSKESKSKWKSILQAFNLLESKTSFLKQFPKVDVSLNPIVELDDENNGISFIL